jgi:hypothetical protein
MLQNSSGQAGNFFAYVRVVCSLSLDGARLFFSFSLLATPDHITMLLTAASVFESVLPAGAVRVDLIDRLQFPDSLLKPEHSPLTP